MHPVAMTVKQENHMAGLQRGQGLMAVGGLLGALVASSCCFLPLVLFGLGVSGAWIGNLTQLAPYQPFFIAATIACLGYGYWLVYRSSKVACAGGAACARPLSDRRFPPRALFGRVGGLAPNRVRLLRPFRPPLFNRRPPPTHTPPLI